MVMLSFATNISNRGLGNISVKSVHISFAKLVLLNSNHILEIKVLGYSLCDFYWDMYEFSVDIKIIYPQILECFRISFTLQVGTFWPSNSGVLDIKIKYMLHKDH